MYVYFLSQQLVHVSAEIQRYSQTKAMITNTKVENNKQVNKIC